MPELGEKFECEGWEVMVVGIEQFLFQNRTVTKIYASKQAFDGYHKTVFKHEYSAASESALLDRLRQHLCRINAGDMEYADDVTQEISHRLKIIAGRE